MKKVAVLTSGGDAPGMNAAIRALVRSSIDNNIEIFGIERGFQGVIEHMLIPMYTGSVANIIHRGGTILKTARCHEFHGLDVQKKCAEFLKGEGIDCLFVIGGEGSLKGAKALSDLGVSTIVIPATIDGDFAGSDATIGFDTALNTIVKSVDCLRDTAMSHERVFIVEVMGNRCGRLAIEAGIASGADFAVIPEQSIDEGAIIAKIEQGAKRGKKHSIILIAEGANKGQYLHKRLADLCGIEVKFSVLGHMQRGGAPSQLDRSLASRMGYFAIQSCLEGRKNVSVVLRGNNLSLYPHSICDELEKEKYIIGQEIIACLSI